MKNETKPSFDFLAKHQPTHTTSIVLDALHQFFHNGDWAKEMAFKKQLTQCRLDYSLDSLRRIDKLLDHIRTKKKPSCEAFFDKPSQQHFLIFLAFYCGEMKGRARKQTPIWQTHAEYIAENTGLEEIFPECPEYLFACSFRNADGEAFTHFPLVSILARLFDETPDKSVFFSNSQGMPDDLEQLKKPLPEVSQSLAFSGADLIAQTAENHLPYLQMPTIIGWTQLEQLEQLGKLYSQGRVVWAAITHANSLDNYDNVDARPAEILYDPTGRTPPEQLHQIVTTLFSFQDNPNSAPENIRPYVAQIASGFGTKHFQLNVGHIPIRTTPLTIWIAHFPNGILSLPLFPILIHDDTDAVTMLPAYYWQHTAFYAEWFKQQDAVNAYIKAQGHLKSFENDHPNRETTPAFLSLLNEDKNIWVHMESRVYPQADEMPPLTRSREIVDTDVVGVGFIERFLSGERFVNDYQRRDWPQYKITLTEAGEKICIHQMQEKLPCTFTRKQRLMARFRQYDFSKLLTELENTKYNKMLAKSGAKSLEKVATLIQQENLSSEKTKKLIQHLRAKAGQIKPSTQTERSQPNTVATLYLAYLYGTGKFVVQDLDEMISQLLRANALGDWRAKRWMAEFILDIPDAVAMVYRKTLDKEWAVIESRIENQLKLRSLPDEIGEQYYTFLDHRPAALAIAHKLLSEASQKGHPIAEARLEELIECGRLPAQPNAQTISLSAWIDNFIYNHPKIVREIEAERENDRQDHKRGQINVTTRAVRDDEKEMHPLKNFLYLLGGIALIAFAFHWRANFRAERKESANQARLEKFQAENKKWVDADRVLKLKIKPIIAPRHAQHPPLSPDAIAQIAKQLPSHFENEDTQMLTAISGSKNHVTINIQNRRSRDALVSSQTARALYCHSSLLENLGRAHVPATLRFHKKSGEFWYSVDIKAGSCH